MKVLAKWLQAEDGTHGKRYQIILKAVLMAALPLFCCVVSCASQGKSIGDVSLLTSPWNDELFYYKQVEGIIHYGYPQGYFGFNESHALKLSFAAWSPVLVFPWIIWGLVFGWNLMSPVICNIFLLMMAFFVFMLLVKPTWKQTGILAFLFCLFHVLFRFTLSGMPEIICCSMLILFYGCAFRYSEKDRLSLLVILFVLSGILTLMRPYMLLFMALPTYLCVKKYHKKGAFCSVGVVGGIIALYVLIKHYLGAEYLTPLYYTDWVTVFFEQGVGAGIYHFFGKLYWRGREFLDFIRQGFVMGRQAGAFYASFMLLFLISLWQTVRDAIGKEKNDSKTGRLPIEAHLLFCYVGMLFALLLMYKLMEGGRHMLTFITAGITVVAMMPTKTYKKAILTGFVFAYLFIYKGVEPYDYLIPFENRQDTEQFETWQDIFAERLSLDMADTPNYENVVIWLFQDQKEGKTVNTKWQLLYALPKGMGISCCTKEYVSEHLSELNSRYLATVSGGQIDELCREKGFELIGRDADIAVFALR